MRRNASQGVRTFADAVLPLADVLLARVRRLLLGALEEQVERALGALAGRDEDVLDVGRVEDLAVADDPGPEFADDRLAVFGQRDVGQSGLRAERRA